jgi:hypothetical protein
MISTIKSKVRNKIICEMLPILVLSISKNLKRAKNHYIES